MSNIQIYQKGGKSSEQLSKCEEHWSNTRVLQYEDSAYRETEAGDEVDGGGKYEDDSWVSVTPREARALQKDATAFNLGSVYVSVLIENHASARGHHRNVMEAPMPFIFLLGFLAMLRFWCIQKVFVVHESHVHHGLFAEHCTQYEWDYYQWRKTRYQLFQHTPG